MNSAAREWPYSRNLNDLLLAYGVKDMSFVFAEKKNVDKQETIIVHCDTKIGLFDNARANFSVEEIDLIEKYGVVKMSILGATICVAFAGNNIILAAKLFTQLCKLKTFSVEEAIHRAYIIHSNAKKYSDIEFIICSADDNVLRIDCIKDGKILNNCYSAWLGSYDAFREFQRIRVAALTKTAVEMTDSAFRDVVQGCKDDSVGGLHITASYRPDLKCFCYSERSEFYSDKKQIVKPGETIKFFLDPRDGGFSCHQCPCNFESLVVKIDQMEHMILYSREHRISESDTNNKNLFGLMLPILVKQKENGELVRC